MTRGDDHGRTLALGTREPPGRQRSSDLPARRVAPASPVRSGPRRLDQRRPPPPAEVDILDADGASLVRDREFRGLADG